MRISWLSNPSFVNSGYGVQTRLFLPRLKALGHEVAGIATFGLAAGSIEYDGIKWYPCGGQLYGQDVALRHSQDFQADIMISLMDAWVYDPLQWPGLRWVPWFPVDSEPISPAIVDRVRHAFQPIVYSQYAVAKCQEAGLEPLYVPHAVDTSVFKPIDKAAAREFMGWPDDWFVFCAVLHNKGYPSRKAFYEHLEAFARVYEKHKDARLYIHCNPYPNGDGVNVVNMAHHLGIAEAVIFPPIEDYSDGKLDDEVMVNIYNASDCLLSVTMGEGFGVPIIEAQACGLPVIVGDWTAMSELCFTGWKIPKASARKHWNTLDCFWFTPHPPVIADAMEQAYLGSASTPECREVTAKSVRHYDADYVTANYWKPALETIEAKIKETRPRTFAEAMQEVA